MAQNPVKVQIVIKTQDPRNHLTKVEQWDVISAAADTVRAAIEHYVAVSQREHAIDAVVDIIRSPLRSSAKSAEVLVDSPFEVDEEGDRIY